MDMTLFEYELILSTCWNGRYQLLNIDMTKDKISGRYRLELNFLFRPNSSPF